MNGRREGGHAEEGVSRKQGKGDREDLDQSNHIHSSRPLFQV